MAAEDNKVLKMAMDLSKTIKNSTPEALLYGFSKLLLMNESAVQAIFSDEEIKELEEVRGIFAKYQINLTLVKNGMLLFLTTCGVSETHKANCELLDKVLQGSGTPLCRVIAAKAIEFLDNNARELFTGNHTMEDIAAKKSELEAKAKEAEKSAKSSNEAKPQAATGNAQGNQQTVRTAATRTPIRPVGASKANVSLGDLKDKYREMTIAMLNTVKGQDSAVIKFIEGCFQGEVFQGFEKKDSPTSYFFFFGPPGTGKTLLAKTAAKYMGRPFKPFNMSEYSEEKAHIDLIGANPNFSKAEPGILVDYVDKNPNALILFDEIEKAHPVVIKLFLQILSEGVLGNAFTKKDTNFKNTILIFTSNVGADLYAERDTNLTILPEKVIINAVSNDKKDDGKKAFPPELVSRLSAGNVIMFNHLGIGIISELVQNTFDEAATLLSEAYGCTLDYPSELPTLFLANRGTDIDARVATSQSMQFIKNEIYELLRQTRKVENNTIKHISMEIDTTDAPQEILDLFRETSLGKVIMLVGEDVIKKIKIPAQTGEILWATSIDEAKEFMKEDIAAIFIDPLYHIWNKDPSIQSATDFDAEGVEYFHEIMRAQTGMPVFILNVNKQLSKEDALTFAQEGARRVIDIDDHASDKISDILYELSMETKNINFGRQGWVVCFNTRQEVRENGEIKIVFYDLRRGRAIDVDSRGTVLSDVERPTTKFDDVVGASYAKEELRYFIDYLKNPKAFLLSGGSKPPRGVLLYGNPGTGKTMLARAMAGESDVTFIATSASEFKSTYVGGGEANIRNLFKRARKYAPSIVFIDEIDAIGKRRTGSTNTATTESMLNALLTEMDGFNGNNRHPVFVLAATNYGVGSQFDGIDTLDPALMRRFDNKIEVELPNKAERLEYIVRTVRKKNLTLVTNSVMKNLAERSNGKSLSTLQNVLELAVRNAIKAKHEVTDEDILEAWEQERYGVEKESTPEHMKITAVHEAGHALVNYLSGECPSHITIHSRKGMGGYMEHAHNEDVKTKCVDDIIGNIRTSLAGRAAEVVVFGGNESINTGAGSDLEHATWHAHQLLYRYCMDERNLAVIPWDEIYKAPGSEEYLKNINEILQREYAKTIELLAENKALLLKIADTLFDKGQLTGSEFLKLVK